MNVHACWCEVAKEVRRQVPNLPSRTSAENQPSVACEMEHDCPGADAGQSCGSGDELLERLPSFSSPVCDQERALIDPPDDERPRRAVPQPAEHHRDEEVPSCVPLRSAAA